MKHLMPVLLLISLVAAGAAGAEELRWYPEFRYASGLPGGGFGVDPLGHIGIDGALQVNIPIGYTPGWGNFAVGGSAGAVNGGFPTDWEGDDVNGTAVFGAGVWNDPPVWVTYMGTGKDNGLEPVWNIQVQVLREGRNWPGISVGVLDLQSQRTDDLMNPFAGRARSFFVAATREGGSPKAPLYYTVGWGTGRFETPFAGISYHPLNRLSVYAEYDGLSPNAGFAYDVVRDRSNEWHAVFSLSVIDLERFNVGVTLTKTDF
jgi:hypothetical protein